MVAVWCVCHIIWYVYILLLELYDKGYKLADEGEYSVALQPLEEASQEAERLEGEGVLKARSRTLRVGPCTCESSCSDDLLIYGLCCVLQYYMNWGVHCGIWNNTVKQRQNLKERLSWIELYCNRMILTLPSVMDYVEWGFETPTAHCVPLCFDRSQHAGIIPLLSGKTKWSRKIWCGSSQHVQNSTQ